MISKMWNKKRGLLVYSPIQKFPSFKLTFEIQNKKRLPFLKALDIRNKCELEFYYLERTQRNINNTSKHSQQRFKFSSINYYY